MWFQWLTDNGKSAPSSPGARSVPQEGQTAHWFGFRKAYSVPTGTGTQMVGSLGLVTLFAEVLRIAGDSPELPGSQRL